MLICQQKRQSKFASEFEEAIYGSESEADSDSETEAARPKKGKRGSKGAETFIVEDEEEPLDLLDRKSLANISTTRPHRTRIGDLKKPNALKPKTNADGKLVLGANDDDNYEKEGGDDDVDMAVDNAGGVNAYVEAITGKDAYKRGQRNRVKFSNKRSRDEEGDEDMGDDDGATSGGYSSSGKKAKEMSGRKGLGVKGVKEGRVGKGQGQRRGGRGK